MKRLTGLIVLAVSTAACSGSEATQKFTLYRNSPVDPTLRVHWATFDAADSDRGYNLSNCQMAARLLNANVDASAKAEGKQRDPMLGFWCEPGGFSEKGTVPMSFPSAFPTDA